MMKNVIVFSTPTCPWCTKVKSYLREKKVPFKEVDVSKDPRALKDMISRSKQEGVPQIWIDREAIVGFDQQKIERLLKK